MTSTWAAGLFPFRELYLFPLVYVVRRFLIRPNVVILKFGNCIRWIDWGRFKVGAVLGAGVLWDGLGDRVGGD
jgi:hypothetical protein